MFVKSSNCMCKTALGLQSPQLYSHERIYALNSFMWVQLKVLQCQNKHWFLASNVSSIYKRINQAFIFNEFSSQFFKSVFEFVSSFLLSCCWCCYHSDLSDPFYSFCFFLWKWMVQIRGLSFLNMSRTDCPIMMQPTVKPISGILMCKNKQTFSCGLNQSTVFFLSQTWILKSGKYET